MSDHVAPPIAEELPARRENLEPEARVADLPDPPQQHFKTQQVGVKGMLDEHEPIIWWVALGLLVLLAIGFGLWMGSVRLGAMALFGVLLVYIVVKVDKPHFKEWGRYIEMSAGMLLLVLGILMGSYSSSLNEEAKAKAENQAATERQAKEEAEAEKLKSEEGRKAALGTVDELKKQIPGPTEIKIDAAKYKELVEAAAKANVTTGGPTVAVATGTLAIGPDHVTRTGPKTFELKKVGGTRWVYVPGGGKAQMAENGGGLKVEDKGDKIAVTVDGNIPLGSEVYLFANDGKTTSNSVKVP